ncbi:MAG: cupin domain-containing protein [Candidatus Aenigmarchaeota archaeon]|nr:cupin domain-containing protein [Candidatus Aenigmarchaeota archaeon]
MKTESLLKPPESKVLKSGRVILSKGEEIGEHVTDRREEIIVVLRGTATMMEESRESQLAVGQTHYIKEGVAHNVRNDSDDELEYIYVVSLFD